MAVESYSLNLLNFEDCRIKFTPEEFSVLLKAWRNGHETNSTCNICKNTLSFPDRFQFTTCCHKFFYQPTQNYSVESIAVPSPGYTFVLQNLKNVIERNGIQTDQDYLVFPDPIYWQVPTTLVYEKVMKFIQGIPMTKRTNQVQPRSKTSVFYKQLQEAPLNHGSLFRRSGGKNTFFRQIAFGKRCTFAMRAMIVPESSLRPNEIALPEIIQNSFDVLNKWTIINRMPSLQPGNFVALRVTKIWKSDCFGIPLEIVEQMNADFDGDECNLYLVFNFQSQAEVEQVLDSKMQMWNLSSGLKLNPCQDMLVVFHMFYDEIDFLPYKNRQSLKNTFRVIYDLYGSNTTFECFDRMRRFYLDIMQNRIVFAITLKEIEKLVELATESGSYNKFVDNAEHLSGCLVTQVKAEAKGSFYHLYQMFGSVELQSESNVNNSFWSGLNPVEAMKHATTAFDALLKTSQIWEPGYGYSKSVYNLQGLRVDYLGRLVDGNAVIENDVLNAMYYTDLMSEEGFAELLQRDLLN